MAGSRSARSASYTITATDTTTGTVTPATTNSFTVTAGPPTKLVFTSTVSGNQTVSSTATVGPFAVQSQDQFGNPVANTGAAVTLNLSTSSTGTAGHAPFFTTANGGAAAGAVTIPNGASTSSNFYYSDTKAGTPTITLAGATVNGQGVTGATTNGFTMVADNANKFAFTTTVAGNHTVGNTATVGPFAVQVQDQFGNPVANTGAAATLSLSSTSTGTTFFTTTNGGAAAGAVTIANGASTSSNFYYADTKAGTPTINLAGATVNGQAVTGASTGGFTMVAGNANKFVFITTVSGNQTVSATATVGPFAVQVQDQFGNPVANTGFFPVTLNLSTTSAGTTGHAPFFTTTNGGAAAGAVTIANGASTSSNFYYSDSKAGSPTVNLAGATVNGQALTGISTNGFTMVAGNANKLAFTTTVLGNQTVSATATVGPFAVQVQDSFGNPVANTGTPVSLLLSSSSTGTTFFTTTNGGAAAGAVTIANGASTSSNFYYSDTKSGTPTITASATVNTFIVSGTTNGFTMVAGAENKLGITTQPPASVGAGTSFTVGVSVEDQFGNTVTTGAGATDHISLALSSGSFSAGATTATAVAGVATFSGLQMTAPGSYTITASDTTTPAVTSAETNSFTITPGPASKFVFTTTVAGNHTVGNTATVGPFASRSRTSSATRSTRAPRSRCRSLAPRPARRSSPRPTVGLRRAR